MYPQNTRWNSIVKPFFDGRFLLVISSSYADVGAGQNMGHDLVAARRNTGDVPVVEEAALSPDETVISGKHRG
jgi:hypothetical protein